MKITLKTPGYVQPNSKEGDTFEVDDEYGSRLVERGLAAEAEAEQEASEVSIPEGDPSESWTKPQLEAWAEQHNVELPSGGTKAEYMEAIHGPEEPAEGEEPSEE